MEKEVSLTTHTHITHLYWKLHTNASKSVVECCTLCFVRKIPRGHVQAISWEALQKTVNYRHKYMAYWTSTSCQTKFSNRSVFQVMGRSQNIMGKSFSNRVCGTHMLYLVHFKHTQKLLFEECIAYWFETIYIWWFHQTFATSSRQSCIILTKKFTKPASYVTFSLVIHTLSLKKVIQVCAGHSGTVHVNPAGVFCFKNGWLWIPARFLGFDELQGFLNNLCCTLL